MGTPAAMLSEYFQTACRQILLIKRNRKLCGPLLPWEFQCVWGRGFSVPCVHVVLFAGLVLRLAAGQDSFDFPTPVYSRGTALAPALVCILPSHLPAWFQGSARPCPAQVLGALKGAAALPESPAL